MQRKLGSICAVTTTVPDLDAIERAYTGYLGYRPVARGTLDARTAQSWDAPAAAGSPWLALQPASGEACCLRFVERPPVDGFRALTTHGWSSTELVVQDVDALAPQLRDSPFTVIGAPRDLDGVPTVRAMQVLGPAGECLYLTRIGAGTPVDLAEALSFVGRVFIAVLGGPDLEALCRFYAARFGNEPGRIHPARITVLSRANNLPIETKHDLATLPLANGTMFELDRNPSACTDRTRHDGDLPPGMAIVTCEVGALDGDDLLAAPAPATLPPFAGAASATLRGPAGELLELVIRQ